MEENKGIINNEEHDELDDWDDYDFNQDFIDDEEDDYIDYLDYLDDLNISTYHDEYSPGDDYETDWINSLE